MHTVVLAIPHLNPTSQSVLLYPFLVHNVPLVFVWRLAMSVFIFHCHAAVVVSFSLHRFCHKTRSYGFHASL